MGTQSILEQQSQELAALVERGAPGVAGVVGHRRHGGSALVWNQDGVVITALHVLESTEEVTLTQPDGTRVAATVAGVDPGRDLAVLRAPKAGLTMSWKPAELASARVGHLALALARPGKTARARLGVLTALGPQWASRSGASMDHYVECDAGRSPGFSGGPLLNTQGHLVGMCTSGLLRNTGVAVPVQTLARVVDEILSHGRLRKAWLGVAMQPVRLHGHPQAIKDHSVGLLISQVEKDAPAARAGILVGDVLISLGSDGIQTLEELQALFDGANIGRSFEAVVLRGGELKKVPVTLDARP